MDYNEALQYIHSFHSVKERRTLTETKELLRLLGSPEERLRFVHIAGTNGKGSTAAMLESVLRAAGMRTGLFTSPYIERFNERIRAEGRDIPDGELAELVEELRPAVESLRRRPTEFELVTVMGLVYFEKKGCDMAVIEVGLGGRDDYTNVIPPPEVAVITRLGLDHTERLGKTLDEIAFAKAGIIKPGSRVVSYEENRVLERVCREMGVKFTVAPETDITPPLLGEFQRRNAAVAAEAARELGIDEAAIREGIGGTVWRGRFEVLSHEPEFILDGSHNPQAIAEAIREFNSRCPGKKLAVTAVMSDKDVDAVIRELTALDGEFITVPVNYPRALDPVTYAERLRAAGLRARPAATIEEGVREARREAGGEGAVIALGTLYFSKEIREAAAN